LKTLWIKRWYRCLLVSAIFCPGSTFFAQESIKDTTIVVKKNVPEQDKLDVRNQKKDSISNNNSIAEVDSTGKKLITKEIKGFRKGFKMPFASSNTKKDTSSSKDKAKNVLPKTDSLHLKSTLVKKLGLNDTTSIFKKLEKTAKTSGNVSAGYDYGVVPFTTNTTLPLGFYKAEGNIKVEAMKLPFDVTFYYSDLNTISGLHNYFRVSFDSKKFQDNMRQKASGQVEEQKGKLGNLYKERQDLERKLYYLKSMPEPSDYEQGIGKSFDYTGMMKTPAMPKVGTLPKDSVKLPKDSLSSSGKGSTDSLARSEAKLKHEADSIAAFQKEYEHKYDSIQKVITKYQKQLDQIEWAIMYAKKLMHSMDDPNQIVSGQTTPYLSKTENLFLKVKKLDIGLCYPNNSTFLISGSAIKGVNLEMENENFFFAFTSGKTLSNLIYSTNPLQNNLNNTQNLYNFFDFNNVNSGRRVTSVKFGPGRKEGTHLHVGILYGYGSTSYPFDLNPTGPTGLQYEKNYVVELDGKIVVTKNNVLDLVYGKSAILQSSVSTGDFQKGVSAIFDPLRSNAALVRFTSTIPKTKTKVTLTTRWVDPFFKSYGVGFMRDDNFRYEIKAEQTLTSKIKLTTFFRKEQDNLLSYYNYTTNLTTIGANLSVKINRNFSVRVGYNPVLQTVVTKDNSYSLNNHNNISNLVLIFNPHLKKFSSTFNALYSYYNLSNVLQTNEFQSVNVSNTTQFKSGFRFISSATWFHSSVIDTNGNNTLLIVEEVGYSFKKGAMVSIGGKAAHNTVIDWEYGYMAKFLFPVIKHFSLEGSFEKLVIGDFYNSLNRAQVEKFPYYCSLKVTYKW